jgi:hypothetical protein
MRKPKHVHEAKLTKGTLPSTRSALLARIKTIERMQAASRSKRGVHRPWGGRLPRYGRSSWGTAASELPCGRGPAWIVADIGATGPERWRDMFWLLMTMAGLLLIVCAALVA